VHSVGRDAWAGAETHCFLIEGPRENEKVIAEATAHCSVQDNFNKETGRALALRRAVYAVQPDNEPVFDRDVQGLILSAYFNRARHRPKKEEPTDASTSGA
jgi:hypothetical protein